MILPKEIKTQHKIRDFKIISLYAQSKTMAQIGERFKLSPQRIERIINTNKELLSIDRKYEKFKRINYLKRQLIDKNGNEKNSKADPIEIIENLRKENEGDSIVNVITQFLNITPTNMSENNRLNALQSPQ